jgi:hypothetical protein
MEFCKEYYCKFSEFEEHVNANLMADLEEAERYCNLPE